MSRKGNITPYRWAHDKKGQEEKKSRLAEGFAAVTDWLKEHDTQEKRRKKRADFSHALQKEEEKWIPGRQYD